ncbi:hypothetical protein KKE60_07680, partial [Patescibacteria group bacterium]|nr:hypothetical protein [Patescibacteria group bacterium]
MAPPKSSLKGSLKSSYICNECALSFTGTKCPSCGNRVGNRETGENGIEYELNKPGVFMSPESGLNNGDVDDDFLYSVQASKMANETFKENMRDAYVMKSEISRLEAEKKLLGKRREVDRLRDGIEDVYPPDHHTQESVQSSMAPLFGSQSPQAQFMSQLMKMDNDRRGDFIAQLSDADPQALSTLSS